MLSVLLGEFICMLVKQYLTLFIVNIYVANHFVRLCRNINIGETFCNFAFKYFLLANQYASAANHLDKRYNIAETQTITIFDPLFKYIFKK
jgi:hypothetical protein